MTISKTDRLPVDGFKNLLIKRPVMKFLKRLFFKPFHLLSNNPIIFNEFVKQFRSGRFFIMLFLLLVVGSVVVVWFWSTPNQSNFPSGRKLFFALVTGEIIAIFLMLPAIVAHSLIVEKDRNTLPLLLTTPLGAGKILAGKLISTLGIVVLLIMASWPLISMCLARGGVAPWEVLVFAFALVYISFVVSSFAAFHAMRTKTIFRTLITTQVSMFLIFIVLGFALTFASGIMIGLFEIFFNLLSQLSKFEDFLGFFRTSMKTLFFIINFILLSAIPLWTLYLSKNRLDDIEPKVTEQWEFIERPSFQIGQVVAYEEDKKEIKHSYWERQEGKNPFYLRERLGYTASHSPMSVPSWYLIALLAHVLFILTPIQGGRWVAVIVFLFIAQIAPIYAATLFAGERENYTWELLITTVSKSTTLLNGKMLGALYQTAVRVSLMFYPPFLLAITLTSLLRTRGGEIPGPPPESLLIYTIILGGQVLFIMSLTSYLSLCLERVNHVLTRSWCIIASYCIIPYLLVPIFEQNQLGGLTTLTKAISPIYLIQNNPSAMLLIVYLLLILTGSIFYYLLSLAVLQKNR